MTIRMGVIDRIESEETAVVLIIDDNKKIDIPMFLLPDDAKEGDWLDLEYQNDEIVNILINKEETEKALKRSKEKLEKISKNNT